jgi:hypothetical protein
MQREITMIAVTKISAKVSRMKRIMLPMLLLATVSSHADTPSFDRPGIAFSTQTLPAGSMDWEQGLPDVVHNKDQGTESTLYSAGTRVRVGLTSNLELQIADSLFNRLETRTTDATTIDHGASDLTLALKLSMPSTETFSWAMLGGVSLTTGKAPFTGDTQQYLVAISASVHLDSYAAGAYVGATRAGRDNSYTLAPNFSFPLSTNLGGYLEAGYSFGSHIDKTEVAGGGLAWMANDRVQLDIYALYGLTERSTDLQAGFGLSIYMP